MIKELLENKFDIEKVTEELEGYIAMTESLMDKMEELLNEGAIDEGSFFIDEIIRQMEAAKRGLSIISRLPPGEDRAKHASRVMTNMNKIRGRLRRAKKAIAAAMNPHQEERQPPNEQPEMGAPGGQMGSASGMPQ